MPHLQYVYSNSSYEFLSRKRQITVAHLGYLASVATRLAHDISVVVLYCEWRCYTGLFLLLIKVQIPFSWRFVGVEGNKEKGLSGDALLLGVTMEKLVKLCNSCSIYFHTLLSFTYFHLNSS